MSNWLSYIIGKNGNQSLLRLLIILSIILILIWIFKRFDLSGSHEGFSQDERFVAKYNTEVYDEFYAEIYDKIHIPQNQFDAVKQAIKMTEPTSRSVFLDVGSGTGGLVSFLQNQGYNAYGIDKSEAMIKYSMKKYPDIKVKNGDILTPMAYDRNTFSHVLCTDFSIYQFKDKANLFRNIYYWLNPNGYLVLHLVDRKKYDPIVSAGKPMLLDSPQKYATERITDTEIDFIDFKYKSSVDFTKKDITVVTETFTDGNSYNVRQNEQTLFMEDMQDIIYTLQYCGFINHGQIALPFDENQYIFVLERPL